MDVQSWAALFDCEIAVEEANLLLLSMTFYICCCCKLKREVVKIISRMENVVKEIIVHVISVLVVD